MAGRTILVVDDEDDLRDTLCELLSLEGFDAVGARNGKEGLALLDGSAAPPSLILLDLLMPILDGAGFLQELAVRGATIPVIITTSVPERAPPGFRVLAKPMDLDCLLTAVRSVLAA